MPHHTVLSDWFERRRDAVEDLSHMASIAITTPMPADIIAAQLRFGSLALTRLAADVVAYQDMAQELWGVMFNGSAAQRVAAATRAAGQPLREAPGSQREATG